MYFVLGIYYKHLKHITTLQTNFCFKLQNIHKIMNCIYEVYIMKNKHYLTIVSNLVYFCKTSHCNLYNGKKLVTTQIL